MRKEITAPGHVQTGIWDNAMDTPPRRIRCHPIVTSSAIYFMEVMYRTDNSVSAAMILIVAATAFHLLRRSVAGVSFRNATRTWRIGTIRDNLQAFDRNLGRAAGRRN